MDFDHVFAVPGADSIIDFERPDGRAGFTGETLEELQQRHPGAVRISWEDWRAAAAARQDTPITWAEVTADRFIEMLEVLPPIAWDAYGFMVGEACDHSLTTGAPRFQAFRQRGALYEASSRPLTVAEFRAIKEAERTTPK